MATAVRDIDYHHLADLAEKYDVDFVTLCKKAEVYDAKTDEELLGRKYRPSDHGWLTTLEAAERLCILYGGFVSVMAECETGSFGVRSKSRSRKKADARRGAGVLYLEEDIQEVARLKSELRLNVRTALGLFLFCRDGSLARCRAGSFTDDWMKAAEAAEHLGVTYESFVMAIRKQKKNGGCVRLKGANGTAVIHGKRPRVLYSSDDVRELKSIRKTMGCSLRVAMVILGAWKRGQIEEKGL